MAVINIEKYQTALGAEILGVDRNRMLHDEALPSEVMSALETHGVIVFRNLFLDDETQVAFCKKLGAVVSNFGSPIPQIIRITLDPAKSAQAAYLRGTFDWHIDGTTVEVPVKATFLTAHVLSDRGGETEFASTYAAYDGLSDDEKLRFEDLRVEHSLEMTQRLAYKNPTPEQEAQWANGPVRDNRSWRQRSGR